MKGGMSTVRDGGLHFKGVRELQALLASSMPEIGNWSCIQLEAGSIKNFDVEKRV